MRSVKFIYVLSLNYYNYLRLMCKIAKVIFSPPLFLHSANPYPRYYFSSPIFDWLIRQSLSLSVVGC